MKKLLLLVTLLITVNSWAASLPTIITDDFMKTLAVEVVINNITDFYKIKSLTAGRSNDNNDELAAGFMEIVMQDGKCQKIAAAVQASSCTDADNCKLYAVSLECNSPNQIPPNALVDSTFKI